jgi:hexosaminidase
MQARYQRLIAEGKSEDAQAYLLSDQEDSSSYHSVQGWNDNVINICLPSTYHFMQKVFEELVKMYAEAGSPLHIVHIGGDEVPQGAWMRSSVCGFRGETTIDNYSAVQLRSQYLVKINAILNHLGLITATWEEGLIRQDSTRRSIPDLSLVNSHPLAYAWNNCVYAG